MRRYLWLLVAVPAYGQTLDGVRRHLNQLVSSDSTASIAVAVARDGAIVSEEAFGWADKERRVRATPRMSYSVASLTKTLTATELLILRDAGRIDLERAANAYLAGLPDSVRISSPAWNASQVTVHRLANHTAGLATHYLLCFTGIPNCQPSAPQAIARYAVAIRLPGERFDYSNLGYGILGVIIERVTGTTLQRALQRDLFEPLQLHDTFIGPAGSRAGVAASYDANGRRADGYRSSTPGASDGYASVHDLARFGLFHLHAHLRDQRQVIADTEIDWMQNATVRADAQYQYGLGWWVENDHFGVREVYAAGGTSVASALLALIPSEHLAVAIVANDPIELSEIADDVIGAYLPAFAERRAAAIASNTRASENLVGPPSHPIPALIGSWEGHIATYRGPVPLTVRIDSLGVVRASVAHDPEQEVANSAFRPDGRLVGTFSALLPTDEYRGRTYHLDTELALHGSRLTGYVTATLERSALEGIGLSYWVDLYRQW